MARTRETTPITRDDLHDFVAECKTVGERMRRDPSHLIGAFEQSHATSRQWEYVEDVAGSAEAFLNLVEEYGYRVSYSPYGQCINVDTLQEDGTICEGDYAGISISVTPDAREQDLLSVREGESPMDIIRRFSNPQRYTICTIGDSVMLDRVVAMWLIYQADQMRPGLLDQITQLDVDN
jgi:hypothetical protein